MSAFYACLLLKSLSLRTAENLQTKSLLPSETSRKIRPQIDSDFVFCIGNRMGPSKIKDYIINWFNTYVTSSIRSRQYKYQHSRAGLSVVYRKQTPCDWQLIPFDE